MGLALSLLLLAGCVAIIYFFYQGPAFVPTLSRTVAQIVEVSGVKPGTRAVDLGSGDGRVVIAFARAGVLAEGYEINPLLVWYSRWKIRRAGLENLAKISTSSFWSKNLSEYDIVTVFGIDHVMGRLSDKLKKELKPGSIVISNAFKLPNLTLKQATGSLLIYVID